MSVKLRKDFSVLTDHGKVGKGSEVPGAHAGSLNQNLDRQPLPHRVTIIALECCIERCVANFVRKRVKLA